MWLLITENLTYLLEYATLCNMSRRLTARQEIFAQQIYLGKTATDAGKLAGYNPKWISQDCDKLLKNPNIQARFEEIRRENLGLLPEEVADATERRKKLTEILRNTPGEVMPHHIIQASDQLNKMDKLYSEVPTGYNDNRQYNIYIQGDEAKANLEQLLAGKKPQLTGGADATIKEEESGENEES